MRLRILCAVTVAGLFTGPFVSSQDRDSSPIPTLRKGSAVTREKTADCALRFAVIEWNPADNSKIEGMSPDQLKWWNSKGMKMFKGFCWVRSDSQPRPDYVLLLTTVTQITKQPTVLTTTETQTGTFSGTVNGEPASGTVTTQTQKPVTVVDTKIDRSARMMVFDNPPSGPSLLFDVAEQKANWGASIAAGMQNYGRGAGATGPVNTDNYLPDPRKALEKSLTFIQQRTVVLKTAQPH